MNESLRRPAAWVVALTGLVGGVALIIAGLSGCAQESPPHHLSSMTDPWATPMPVAEAVAAGFGTLSRNVVLSEKGSLVRKAPCNCYVIKRTWTVEAPTWSYCRTTADGRGETCMPPSEPPPPKEYATAQEALSAYLAAHPEPTP
jgi:hypothetical protein